MDPWVAPVLAALITSTVAAFGYAFYAALSRKPVENIEKVLSNEMTHTLQRLDKRTEETVKLLTEILAVVKSAGGLT